LCPSPTSLTGRAILVVGAVTMHPWTSVLLGLLLSGGLALVLLKPGDHTAPPPAAAHPAPHKKQPATSPDAGLRVEASAPKDAGSPLAQAAPSFDTLPNGTPVPELPESAPKEVSFGVVLFQYEGAELAQAGTRTKPEALKLARETVQLAQTDFGEAVKRGDRGSTDDAGSLPRGVLEPGPEYVLFTLAAGAVYPEPIDTPRGYWVVRRR
jgi:hypothetical protein